MIFNKYSLKTQILLGCIFGISNFLFAAFCTQILKIPLFMDMIFVYAGSFIGIPCGFIVGIIHTFLNAVIFQHNLMHMLYCLCCITGTLLTWYLVTRREDFNWVSLTLLIFVSTVIISLEGSLIYYFFFASDVNYKEDVQNLYLTYNLVMRGFGLQLSAFLARLPVNLIDKTIAVLGGFGVYVAVNKCHSHRS